MPAYPRVLARAPSGTAATVLALMLASAAASPASAARGGKPKPAADTTAPVVAIGTPSADATLAGTMSVAGTASDNTNLAKVEVSVDGGPYGLASGTSSWNDSIDTTAYGDGAHTLAARATDASGNRTVVTVAVSFANSSPATSPSPPPPVDTTPPLVAIDYPSGGATLAGSVWVSGTASDETGLALVEVSVDAGAFQPATGTESWRKLLDTTACADGSHSITVRATDTSGNASTTRTTVNVKNSATPSGLSEQLITPEGATIQISSDVTGWSAQQVYSLLKANALELSRIGPTLKVKVQTTYASSTSASATQTNGVYGGYRATVYLQAKPGTTFTNRPDSVVAHEYGHAWTLYHLYISHQGDWSPWLAARGLLGDPRVDSTYNWSKSEMIAEDYRMLFGTSAAVSQATYTNPDVADPRNVPGLREFFLSSWATP